MFEASRAGTVYPLGSTAAQHPEAAINQSNFKLRPWHVGDVVTATLRVWVQGRLELGDDYSHYKFEYEEIQNHLHIEGILGKEERSKGSRAPEGTEGVPKADVRKKNLSGTREKVENMPPLTGERR